MALNQVSGNPAMTLVLALRQAKVDGSLHSSTICKGLADLFQIGADWHQWELEAITKFFDLRELNRATKLAIDQLPKPMARPYASASERLAKCFDSLQFERKFKEFADSIDARDLDLIEASCDLITSRSGFYIYDVEAFRKRVMNLRSQANNGDATEDQRRLLEEIAHRAEKAVSKAKSTGVYALRRFAKAADETIDRHRRLFESMKPDWKKAIITVVAVSMTIGIVSNRVAEGLEGLTHCSNAAIELADSIQGIFDDEIGIEHRAQPHIQIDVNVQGDGYFLPVQTDVKLLGSPDISNE